ncbi:Phenyllactate dehydrogenase [Dyadobacter sp. CECT 9623]|uniref:Phenyllactate dehydrogenase n=1 Tax=Dyadobacter linearis TaxID=2823330 RepID=A0ABM8UJ42_9BACT|nr:hypothetical protein [Dyadobacter sp. CECT 9623]CAG5067522.1 Phenyllactate dehydrogenase [Dyadobacter sp. CECT 9623]
MKVVAYSIKAFEKEPLAKANQKKHNITLISNSLSETTCHYARGKNAVIVSTCDDVSAAVVDKLADLGISFIATRSFSTDHIDKDAIALSGIRLANVAAGSLPDVNENAIPLTELALQHIAAQTIKNLDLYALAHLC